MFCAVAGMAQAHDFSLVLSGGQTLYFNFVPGGVEVTYPAGDQFPVNGWVGYERPAGVLQIPSQVTHEGAVYDVVRVGQLAFYGCSALTSVSVGDGVNWLGNSAFKGCTGLQTVVIPASVDTIGLRTFDSCMALADMWMGGAVPPRTSPYAFMNCQLASATLHVPVGSESGYQSVAVWNAFGTVAGGSLMATVTVMANDPARGTVSGSGSYVIGTTHTISALPTSGNFFACWNDGDTRNPRPVTLTGDMTLWAMFFPRVVDTVGQELVTLSVASSASTLGLGVGSCTVPVNTWVEICALPLGGTFSAWSDGSTENPRRVKVAGPMALTAFFEQLAVPSAEVPEWSVCGVEGGVMVNGARDMELSVYRLDGTLAAAVYATSDRVFVPLSVAGAYVVRVGVSGAKKVVVE